MKPQAEHLHAIQDVVAYVKTEELMHESAAMEH